MYFLLDFQVFFIYYLRYFICYNMLHIHQRKLLTVAIIFLVSWIVGTFFIHRFEAGFPIGASYFNAFYFTVITTATIGFGDLVPMTIAGKVLTM